MVADRRLAPCWGVAFAVVLGWPLQGLAQEAVAHPDAPRSAPSVPIAAARDAFELGATLAHHGQWVDALIAFERSYRLHPHATTLFNVGFCERALGRYTRARKSFRSALAAHHVHDEPLTGELAAEAQGYLDDVERRIVRATVVIRQPTLRLTVNGRPLEAETLQPAGRTFYIAGTRDAGPPEAPPVAVFELLLDPGEQSIIISTDGVDRVVTRHFEPGSAPRIELSAPAAPQQRLAGRRPIAAERAAATMTLPAVAYGVGAAGLVVGTVFGIATLQNAKRLSEQCPEKSACPEEAKSDIDASKRNALISNIGFGVALAGGIVGTYLLLTAPRAPEQRLDARRPPVVQARLGLGRVDIEASF